jgi:hypothetical protein
MGQSRAGRQCVCDVVGAREVGGDSEASGQGLRLQVEGQVR